MVFKKRNYKCFWFFFFSKKEVISSLNYQSIISCSEISFFYKLSNLFVFFKKFISVYSYKAESNIILLFLDHFYLKTCTSSIYKFNKFFFNNVVDIKKKINSFILINTISYTDYQILYTIKQKKTVTVGYIDHKFSLIYLLDYKIPVSCKMFFNVYFINLFFLRYFNIV